MQGSLALHKGSVFVGRYEKTAHVTVHSLDGHPLAGGFSFRDEAVGRSSVSGLSVDDDRRIWVADAPAARVRTFTLFGAEVGEFCDSEGERASPRDLLGQLGVPVDVCADGDADEERVLVASAGRRRYALSLYDVTGRLQRSLRPVGDPDALFHGIEGIALLGKYAYAAESAARQVQVFRDAEFHFAFSVPSRKGPFEPTAVAPLEDGRMLVTVRGRASALLLVDGAGRLLETLACSGSAEGELENPSDVVVEEHGADRETRLAVIDRDGNRVQVFNLEGRCYGAFLEGGAASAGSH